MEGNHFEEEIKEDSMELGWLRKYGFGNIVKDCYRKWCGGSIFIRKTRKDATGLKTSSVFNVPERSRTAGLSLRSSSYLSLQTLPDVNQRQYLSRKWALRCKPLSI